MRLNTLIIAVLLSLSSWAQFQLEAKLDTSQILVGQQTHLRLTVSGIGNPTALVWPDFRTVLPDEIELIETSPVTRVFETDDTYQLSLLVTAWDSGYFAIAPMPVAYLDSELETEAMLFTVNNVPVNLEAAPRDIKEIYAEPFNLLDWVRNNWLIIAFVSALLLVVLMTYRLMKRKTATVDSPKLPEVQLSPHDKALMRLDDLKNQNLHTSKNKKPFYSELTEILREYLENRYFVPALEQNSSETLESVRYLGLDQQWQDHFRSLLRTADMVKFAKEDANDQVAELHLSRSKDFIMDTIPVAVPETTLSVADE